MSLIKLGINRTLIDADDIPFDWRILHENDQIESASGEILQYTKTYNNFGYILVADKPYVFLTTPYQNWKKI